MQNEKRELLHQIFTRLCFHYGLELAGTEAKRNHFIASLMAYPDDLICAAYQHILRHPSPQHFPSADDFIAFMQPEYHRRQMEACYG